LLTLKKICNAAAKNYFCYADMNFKRQIAKCSSVLLIVILMLKVGGGLYLHNWLHAQNAASASSGLPALGNATSHCTCIDDFYIPFTEAPEQIVQAPAAIRTAFIAPPKFLIPFFPKFFHSLRGPPSFTA
jgi:hypothetical protein